ncbi:MAG: hypothetical protein ACYCPH_03510 [Minisyncoccota bacterium]
MAPSMPRPVSSAARAATAALSARAPYPSRAHDRGGPSHTRRAISGGRGPVGERRGREITPKLDGYSLSEVAQAVGLSLAACSRFRTGTRVPHPRHWTAFVALVEDGAH